MMSGALRWMALLSGYGGKERHDKHDRYEDRWEDVDREEEYDRKRKPYDARKGYQRRDREHDRYEADEWEPKKLTKSGAEMWVRHMQNSDGSSGEHWDYNQTEQVRQQKGYKCDPVAFYATMNMMYSDYCQAARDIGCNTVDFYAAMAKAFLEDADAPEDKIERYMEYIAEA